MLKADASEKELGWTDEQISRVLEVCPTTIQRVRQQFVGQSLTAALERRLPCGYRPRRLDGEAETHLILEDENQKSKNERPEHRQATGIHPPWLAGEAFASVLSWCLIATPKTRSSHHLVGERLLQAREVSAPLQDSIRIINEGVQVKSGKVRRSIPHSTVCNKDATTTYTRTGGHKIATTCNKRSIIVANKGVKIKSSSVRRSIPHSTTCSQNPTARYPDI